MQAEKFGAHMLVGQRVMKTRCDRRPHLLTLENGAGAKFRPLLNQPPRSVERIIQISCERAWPVVKPAAVALASEPAQMAVEPGCGTMVCVGPPNLFSGMIGAASYLQGISAVTAADASENCPDSRFSW